MKTTVKLSQSIALTVLPCAAGGVMLEISPAPTASNVAAFHLTPDQAGALIFALEQAAEASQISQHRAASVAHGVAL